MFRRQGPGRVGRAQVLETTEASSGRILPFLKLLEILRSFTIGSRAGAKTPPAPCVQAARAPSLRPRPGAVTARPAVADWDAWRCPGGSPDVAQRDGGCGGRGAWRGFRVGTWLARCCRGALWAGSGRNFLDQKGRVGWACGGNRGGAKPTRARQPESRFLETPSSSDLAAKSTGIDPRQSGRQLNGEFSPSAVRPRRGPGLVAIAPGRPVELAVGDGLCPIVRDDLGSAHAALPW